MAKRRTALAEDREPSPIDEPAPPKPSEGPSRERTQTPWRMSMILWGFPLIFFITMAVLKECVGVSFW